MNIATESNIAPRTPGVFSAYRPPVGVFDEMKASTGAVRPHWSAFVQSVEHLGREGLRERRENARQLLREHGVTYNVYDEGRSAERMWDLDMVPLLIGAEEWSRLETGLIQRTRLLNLVLADLYGAQNLLKDGLLPPALVQANPGFLRPCHGLQPPRDLFLTLHAVDLTRAPDGQWWVLADRTQAPSGVGYSLENRIILSRMLPDEFQACHVQRLASFFNSQKDGLRTMSPWTNTPNTVLMTPGPLTETFFEHAYLARYLGFPLVEGSDLTVRDRRVFMKTLDGLQPVDVIIRRVDDTFCDPLEFRSDSFLGVPGLVEAARAGNVAISNALGSGAVEAPAILAFLPALSRHLLGEKLLIPNVATWWCGQKRERNFTLDRLGKLVVKRGFVGGLSDPFFGESLASGDMEKLVARVRANPHAFVGQERVALSTAPVWNGDRLEPRPLTLRCYICATPDGFAVMPGGLTRVSAAPNSPVVSSKHGGGSKDTWVISDGPVEMVTLLDTTGQPSRLERGTAKVPSRIVENLFWLGRYAERLEDSTRLLRTALSRLAGEGGVAEQTELAALARWLVWREKLPARFAGRVSVGELAGALRELVFSEENPGSVRELLIRVGFLTASVRDRLSGDTWRILHQLQTEFPATLTRFTPGSVLIALHRIIFQLAAFSGMEMENMTRGHAWLFLDIGRRIERAINVVMNVRAVLADGASGSAALGPLLEYTDSTMTYRRRYFARPELPTTLELLLSDETNPRSFAFQLATLREHFTELPNLANETNTADRFNIVLGELALTLASLDFDSSSRERMDAGLERLVYGSRVVSDLLTAHYFSHVVPRVN